MRKYGNVTSMYYSSEIRYSKQINWNKQMISNMTNPGKLIYKRETVYSRENYGNVFKPLSDHQVNKLSTLINVGDVILLKDTGDANMKQFIGDILRVERLQNGKIFGKFQRSNVYIDLLPEMDMLENLNRGKQKINFIQFSDNNRER